jgi:hypothetical protein
VRRQDRVTHCPREKAVSGAQIQRGIYIRGGYNGEEGGVGREMVVEPVEGWATPHHRSVD